VLQLVGLQEQRVYRADDIAVALGRSLQSVKERIERGASLRGWSPKDPGNTLRLWLVDADHADVHDPGIAAAQLPSGHWPLPPLSPVPVFGSVPGASSSIEHLFGAGVSDRSGNVHDDLGLRGREQLEMAQKGEAIEREQRLITERDAARREAELLRARAEELSTEVQNIRRGVVAMFGGTMPLAP